MNNITPEVEALLREIASKAARQAVERTLVSYGIDPENPFEFQKDMIHLREWRLRAERIQEKGLMTITVIVITGIAAMLWLGFKSKLGF